MSFMQFNTSFTTICAQNAKPTAKMYPFPQELSSERKRITHRVVFVEQVAHTFAIIRMDLCKVIYSSFL